MCLIAPSDSVVRAAHVGNGRLIDRVQLGASAASALPLPPPRSDDVQYTPHASAPTYVLWPVRSRGRSQTLRVAPDLRCDDT